MDNRKEVIDEMIYNLSLLNDNRIEDLRHAISEKDYFESFLGLAKTIAPDGDNVRMVGVTALREGTEVSVGLNVTGQKIKPIISDALEKLETQQETREPIQITGELLYAEAIKKNRIKIVDDNNKTHSVEVSEAIAEDVVRPFFGSRVTVDVVRIGGKRLLFRDINPSEY